MRKFEKMLAATVKRISLFAALVVTASTSFAAQVPAYNTGDALKEATPPPAPAQKVAPAPQPQIVIQQEQPFSLADGQKILVKDFRLEGAKTDGESLQAALAILAPYKNRELTMAEITEAVNKLTILFRSKGYLLAKAYVPKQDARDGILTVRIVLGEYGKIILNNKSQVSDFLVKGIFEHAKSSAAPVVTKDGLERAMLIVGDLPGNSIPTVTVAPGSLPGTSDFTVNVEPGKRLDGYVMADNQGSRFTGKDRLYAGVDVNSPFALGDKLSVNGETSEGKGLQNLRVAYGLPLAYNGMRAELAASRTLYTLGEEYASLDASGTADVLEGTISYPVRKSREDTIDLSLNVAGKLLRDIVGVADPNPETTKHVVVATLGAQRGVYGTLWGRNLFTTMSGGINVGNLSIGEDFQKAQNQAGANTTGIYSKANLALTGNLSITDKFSAKSSLKVQKAITGRNMDGTEQMGISGNTGVRAYPEGIEGDNGYLVSADLRYALSGAFKIEQTAGLFVDNGGVYAQHGAYANNSDRIMLTDAGVGYYLGFRKLSGSVQVAQALGHMPSASEIHYCTRVLLQVSLAF